LKKERGIKMEKILFYGMTGEKMCFQHILMNAVDMHSAGADVKIIFEGASVKLLTLFEEEKNPMYMKAKDAGLIAGVCLACSKVLGVYEQNKALGLIMLDDMFGHAGMKSYIQGGYKVVSI
jgi:hypothetical protein